MSRASSQRKLTPNDFLFGRMIGEGSFSCVFLAKEIYSGREMAVKVLQKDFIRKEKKTDYVFSEKNILKSITDSWDSERPFFVKLHSTFMDRDRLYFVMTYAPNGDLLRFMETLAQQNVDCTQFYTAQIISAIEFLHFKVKVVHRDLKPENILLNAELRILITDFGSAKFIDRSDKEEPPETSSSLKPKKRVSFVGTPQYISPEVLSSKSCGPSADLWALGCILYQMVTGLPPFQSQSEYIILKKIEKLEYDFHEGFNEDVKDLVRLLLVLEPQDRIGAKDSGHLYTSLRAHKFFEGLEFDTLHNSTPDEILKLAPKHKAQDPVWERNPDLKPGVDRLAQLMIEDNSYEDEEESENGPPRYIGDPPFDENVNAILGEPHRTRLLNEQIKENKYHRFVEGHLIIKQGLLDKKKGLWARRRMFLLTEGPRLYYVDPDNMVLKGEIPWSPEISPEVRDFRIFFVHTPGRIYHLTDPQSRAKDWCHVITLVKDFYYNNTLDNNKT
uniref:3-phosphoinositide-dependent protein kinase 1 n=1 Tax=Lepeophtheirus salmonis TaxID=72036 RepID=A0A0K2T6Z1_LEPSM